MTVQETIFQIMKETAEEKGASIQPNLQLPIGELGFDSMDWAVIVVKLEQELGFDPFADGARFEINTVQDFVRLYQKE
ncbi:MAG: phosphopantetheine-binding protein [bacterium]|nr:phosphopantetheine-binding protein [bacterium]